MIILHEQKTPVYVAVNACIRVGCNRPLMRFSPTKICVIQFRVGWTLKLCTPKLAATENLNYFLMDYFFPNTQKVWNHFCSLDIINMTQKSEQQKIFSKWCRKNWDSSYVLSHNFIKNYFLQNEILWLGK